MKKITTCLLAFLIGCGETFVPGNPNSGTGGGSTVSTSETLNNRTTTESVQVKVDLFSNCREEMAYIPAQEMKDLPIVSCFAPNSDVEILSFSYQVYGGVYEAYGCQINNHKAVWFVTNSDIFISDDVSVSETNVDVSSLNIQTENLNNYHGPRTTVTVNVENVKVKYNEMFCFGSRFAFSAEAKPTCPVGCFSESELFRHQVALNDMVPYLFRQVNNVPEADLGPKINLLSSVLIKK